jgi:hypothetical protein
MEGGMAIKVNAFLTTVCLLFAVEANALSGNQWKQLSLTQQQYYVMGVLDGWDDLEDTILRAKEQTPIVSAFTKLVSCVEGMAHSQIHVIIQKYMENNPAKWHFGMALLVWNALHEVCVSKSK